MTVGVPALETDPGLLEQCLGRVALVGSAQHQHNIGIVQAFDVPTP